MGNRQSVKATGRRSRPTGLNGALVGECVSAGNRREMNSTSSHDDAIVVTRVDTASLRFIAIQSPEPGFTRPGGEGTIPLRRRVLVLDLFLRADAFALASVSTSDGPRRREPVSAASGCVETPA